MSFTPGPWEYEKLPTEGGNPMTESGGVYFQIVAVIPGLNRHGAVADTLNRDFCLTDDEDRANASLIAAAPELLAMLKKCEQILTFRLDMAEILDEEKAAWSEARALIQKAEGRS